MKNPVSDFKNFVIQIVKGKELISPTLLNIKLELLERYEKEFARSAYQAAMRSVDFEKWYESVTREEEPPKESKKAKHPVSEPDELYS